MPALWQSLARRCQRSGKAWQGVASDLARLLSFASALAKLLTLASALAKLGKALPALWQSLARRCQRSGQASLFCQRSGKASNSCQRSGKAWQGVASALAKLGKALPAIWQSLARRCQRSGQASHSCQRSGEASNSCQRSGKTWQGVASALARLLGLSLD